ncbi:hypothetical protein C8R46DRAFT_1217637 [Mycena filopes]|nr:hypothetical protein C8R46DRAFT_1217637 [Mycena filopes]
MSPSDTETPGKVFAVGLLATTEIVEDPLLMSDFLVWGDLLSEADHARWFAGVNLDPPTTIPHAERLELPVEIAEIIVKPIPRLKSTFLRALFTAAREASVKDTLVIVITGHGEEHSGHIFVGAEDGDAGELELLVKEAVEEEIAAAQTCLPQENVFLMITACYSGLWRSPLWTLLTGAESQARLPPVPANLGDVDFPRDSEPPRRSLKEALRIGGTYKSAVFVKDPATERPSQLELFHRFRVVGPSIPDETTQPITTCRSFYPKAEQKILSPSEAGELSRLALAYVATEHPTIASNVGVIVLSGRLVRGDEIPLAKQHRLLAQLRHHARASRRASLIAAHLRWAPEPGSVESFHDYMK